MKERIWKNNCLLQKEEVRESGWKKNWKKGERNKAIEIAKSLLDVLDIETISIKTGLSIKEIEDIAVMKK